MSRLTEGLSASGALKIRAVSMLAILLMTMFAPAQARVVEDYCFECMSPMWIQCEDQQTCELWGDGQSCQTYAPMHCLSVCGKYYTWQCLFQPQYDCEQGYWLSCQWEN